MGRGVLALRNWKQFVGHYSVLGILLGSVTTADAAAISTIAGTSTIEGRTARSISITPQGIAMSSDGSLYVADTNHAQILRFNPITKLFTAVAGTTIQGNAGDGGPALSAELSFPTSVAFDATGNLLIADAGQGVIRKVSAATGTISTVAGGGYSTQDGIPATSARLEGPWSVASGNDGSIYIIEQDGNRIRRIAPETGLIYTIAGTGTMGYSGDDGPAVNAQLARPSGVAFDALGNLYIADQFNHRVRMIEATTGIIRTFAGTGEQTWNVTDGMPASQTPLSSPSTLLFDSLGNLLVTEHDTGRVRRIEAGTTLVSTIAGGGTQTEGVAALNGNIGYPQAIALATNGDLYVTGENTFLLQRIVAATGMLEALAGNSWPHFSGDGGLALAAQMWPLMNVANANGDQFMIDNSRIRKVNASNGTISTIAGNGEWGVVGDGGPAINAFLSYPTALAIDSTGNLFLSDQGNHRIRKINATTGIITHYGGTGYGYSGDGGLAVNAQMRQIRDLATDAGGNLYIVEEGSARIRKISATSGIITTIAGNGNTSGPWGDGLLATNVALYPLDAITVDTQSNVFIVQQGRIRRINAASGIITTVAGTGVYGESGDGGSALSANLIANDLKVDAAGNLFITSLFTHRVRRIDANTGIITTIAGTGVAGFSGDGGNATQAQLYTPRDLAFDSSGNLYIAEQYHIRKVAGIGAQVIADTTAPVITYSVAGTQGNAQGWYITDATVAWSVTDAESNVTSSSGCAATTISSDTAGTTLTCTATSAGGTASKAVTIKRDTTGALIAFGNPTPAANAAGWNNSDVTIPYTVTDALSGVPGNAQRSVLANSQGSSLRWSVSVTDNAGNWSGDLTPAVNIDKTAPTASISVPANGATYSLGSTVIASYSCNDTLSGIGSCSGTAANGAAIDTSSAGTKTFSITTTDRAGNITTTAYTYTVTGTPAYCSSRGTTSSNEWIKSIKVAGTLFTTNNNGGYADMTLNPIAVSRGNNAVVVKPGLKDDNHVVFWRIWTDLNRDGTFATNELLYSASDSSALSGSFKIPASALSGTTRMRVSMKYGAAASSCEVFSYGEVEDYRVTIP
ncbi:MAG: GEVED domain-containing protein [Steroidobacteraceae bacterium]